MSQISIVGYESDCNCEHCGRALRHGIRLSDGRLVGATCLDKKLTKPRLHQGKSFRFGATQRSGFEISSVAIRKRGIEEVNTPWRARR